MAEEHQITLRDGSVIYAKLLGRRNADKPLVIASHGGPGVESHTEAENSFGFLSNYFRVLVYDLRGSGASTWKGPYTHQQYVADLDEIREWAGAEQFIIAGASYGGIIALEYILRHPQRVACLMLRNTIAVGLQLILGGFKAMLTSHRIKTSHDLLERGWSGTLETMDEFTGLLKDIGVIFKPEFTASGEQRETLPPAERSDVGKLNLEVWNCSASYNLPRYDVRSRLSSIAVPTMVVGGKQDVITTVRHVEEIAAAIPRAELFILDGAGHNLPDDEPELWKHTVWTFLEANEFVSSS